jgi:hypothetical protein
MKALKVLNNQDGMMAMMGAMMFTIAITTTLSTFYVYSLNQAKYHARIKEAYQLINIMESFATATRKAYDMGMSSRAQGSNCPGTNQPPQSINGSTTNFYCAPPANQQTCFTREDTREEYCSVISFASNVTIQKHQNVAQINNQLFLQKWRKGLNKFFVSPGIQNRIVDTSTMAYVIQKPRLLDWLTEKAYAQEDKGGAQIINMTPIDHGDGTTSVYYQGVQYRVSNSCLGSDEALAQCVQAQSNPTRPTQSVQYEEGSEAFCEMYPSHSSCVDNREIVITPTPSPGIGQYPIIHASYIDCQNRLLCSPVKDTGGGTGTDIIRTPEENELDVMKNGEAEAQSHSQAALVDANHKAGVSSGMTSQNPCTPLSTSQVAQFCSSCAPGTDEFCPSVGNGDKENRGISVRRNGQDVRQPLQIRQKYSIVM